MSTSIEWTDETWNPIRAIHKTTGKKGWHCEHVTSACVNCYAEVQNEVAIRGGTGLAYKPGHRKDIDIYLDSTTLVKPLSWRKPRKIFPCSMTDLFGSWVTDEWLDKIFAVMSACPQHTFIVLTKRPERAKEYIEGLSNRHTKDGNMQLSPRVVLTEVCIAERFVGPNVLGLINTLTGAWPLPNVWLLVSCGEQSDADQFIPLLLSTPAAVRGVSAEPLIGPIDFTAIKRLNAEGYMRPLDGRFNKIDWVIVGGESGGGARELRVEWAWDILEQCADAGVACFMKQVGSKSNLPNIKARKGGVPEEWPEWLRVRQWPVQPATGDEAAA